MKHIKRIVLVVLADSAGCWRNGRSSLLPLLTGRHDDE
jgi:hypothetical protein